MSFLTTNSSCRSVILTLLSLFILTTLVVALPPKNQLTGDQVEIEKISTGITPDDENILVFEFSKDSNHTGSCSDAPAQDTAMLLQVFLGFFGAAYGYIGQWGLFVGAFAPIFFFCCSLFGFTCNNDCEMKTIKLSWGSGACLVNLISAVLCTWCLSLWIYGMVMIAQHRLYAGNGCPLT